MLGIPKIYHYYVTDTKVVPVVVGVWDLDVSLVSSSPGICTDRCIHKIQRYNFSGMLPIIFLYIWIIIVYK